MVQASQHQQLEVFKEAVAANALRGRQRPGPCRERLIVASEREQRSAALLPEINFELLLQAGGCRLRR
jgi:hypothetical protein